MSEDIGNWNSFWDLASPEQAASMLRQKSTARRRPKPLSIARLPRKAMLGKPIFSSGWRWLRSSTTQPRLPPMRRFGNR